MAGAEAVAPGDDVAVSVCAASEAGAEAIGTFVATEEAQPPQKATRGKANQRVIRMRRM